MSVYSTATVVFSFLYACSFAWCVALKTRTNALCFRHAIRRIRMRVRTHMRMRYAEFAYACARAFSCRPRLHTSASPAFVQLAPLRLGAAPRLYLTPTPAHQKNVNHVPRARRAPRVDERLLVCMKSSSGGMASASKPEPAGKHVRCAYACMCCMYFCLCVCTLTNASPASSLSCSFSPANSTARAANG